MNLLSLEYRCVLRIENIHVQKFRLDQSIQSPTAQTSYPLRVNSLNRTTVAL
jgi:hypothetical protein